MPYKYEHTHTHTHVAHTLVIIIDMFIKFKKSLNKQGNDS
jgi:hypothetical protein